MGDLSTLSIVGENFSKEGHSESGDDWLAHEFKTSKVCGVLDGARSPYPALKMVATMPSDTFAAYWFKQAMINHLLADDTGPLLDVVKSVNYKYGNMWPAVLEMEKVNTFPNRKVNAPAAAFAFAQLHGTTLSYVQGADCLLFIALPDGTIIPLVEDQFESIDPAKKKQMTWVNGPKLVDQGVDVAEVLRQENAMIAHNRGLIYNQEGGIAVLNGEPDMLGLLEADSLDVSQHIGTGAMVIAMTDGCYQKFSGGSKLASMMAAQSIAQDGLDGFEASLLMLEKPYPTDATVAVMVL